MENKKEKKVNPWLEHCKEVRKNNPSISYKEVLKLAKVSYNKKGDIVKLSDVKNKLNATSNMPKLSTKESNKRVKQLKKKGYVTKEVETPDGIVVLKKKI